jgi:hypothetical protein
MECNLIEMRKVPNKDIAFAFWYLFFEQYSADEKLFTMHNQSMNSVPDKKWVQDKLAGIKL